MSTTRLGNTLNEFTRKYTGEIYGVAIMRHITIAFGRKLRERSSDSRIRALIEEEIDKVLEEAEDAAMEKQAGHSVQIARAVYAKEVGSLFTTQLRQADAYYRASTLWHEWLGFAGVPRAREDAGSESDMARNVDQARMMERRQAPLLPLLRECLGDAQANFRGQQAEAIRAILNMEPAVAYIAGTGCGKSMLFLLPACFRGYGQCLVITPHVALRHSLKAECRRLCITATEWGEKSFDDTARIVLAMPEHLAYERLVRWIGSKRAMRILERIVLDECHLVLTRDSEYWPVLLLLKTIARHRVPLTLITATLPIDR
jgi:hypothetical protein